MICVFTASKSVRPRPFAPIKRTAIGKYSQRLHNFPPRGKVDKSRAWQYNLYMAKKAFTTDGEVAPVYKDMKARKAVLVTGFALCIAAFAATLAAMLIMFVPGLTFKSASLTAFELNFGLFAFGVCASFVGVVFSVAGANTSTATARFSFAFGVLSFIVAAVMMLICLFFKTLLPLDAIKHAVISL